MNQLIRTIFVFANLWACSIFFVKAQLNTRTDLPANLHPIFTTGIAGSYDLIGDTNYNDYFLYNQFVVVFKPSVQPIAYPAILSTIENTRPTSEHIYLPEANSVIVRLPYNTTPQTYELIKKQIEELQEVCIVTPYLRGKNGTQRGILNKVFVSLKKDSDIALLKSLIEPLNIERLELFNALKNVYAIIFTKNSIISPLNAAISLHQSGFFNYAEPNYILNPITASQNEQQTEDTYFNKQWNISNEGTPQQGGGTEDADMDVDLAWTITTGSPNIKVAVIDSGVDTAHADLKSNLVPGYNAINDTGHIFPNLDYPENAHGTACSGIIAAVANNNKGIAGIANNCKIIPIKLFYYIDTLNSILPYSTSEWMAKAYTWATTQGKADVISGSWGLVPVLLPLLPGDPATVEQAITQSVPLGRNGKGVAMFFSSGNDGGLPIWPGYMPEVIAINATSMCDEQKTKTSCDGEQWTGNFGKDLDISAPGVKITTTDISGSKGYAGGSYEFSFNGTSAACPNAAAVAALIYSVNPELTKDEMTHILYSTADKIGNYPYDSTDANGTWTPQVGYGRINAYGAVLKAAGISSTNNTPYNTINLNSLDIIKVFPTKIKNQEPFFVKYKPTTPELTNNAMLVQILNMQGQIVYTENIKSTAPLKQIQTPYLQTGMYMLRLILGNNTAPYCTKILVE